MHLKRYLELAVNKTKNKTTEDTENDREQLCVLYGLNSGGGPAHLLLRSKPGGTVIMSFAKQSVIIPDVHADNNPLRIVTFASGKLTMTADVRDCHERVNTRIAPTEYFEETLNYHKGVTHAPKRAPGETSK